MSTVLPLAVAAALAAGYVLGRVRPFDRLDTWAWRQVTFVGPWMTGSKLRQAVLLAAHGLVRPAATWHAWRHRHDSRPPRSPAVDIPRYDPHWAEKHRAPASDHDTTDPRPEMTE